MGIAKYIGETTEYDKKQEVASMQRIEIPEYMERCVMEVVVNALVLSKEMKLLLFCIHLWILPKRTDNLLLK